MFAFGCSFQLSHILLFFVVVCNSNITACALSGTLGTLLAGNPGPRQRTALVAIIAGFGGTLSSVARFIIEILSLIDPILFRLDGVYYAIASAFWGLVVSYVFSASVDWADSVQ
jgi:fluoride ion exporter CrcB/FEX